MDNVITLCDELRSMNKDEFFLIKDVIIDMLFKDFCNLLNCASPKFLSNTFIPKLTKIHDQVQQIFRLHRIAQLPTTKRLDNLSNDALTYITSFFTAKDALSFELTCHTIFNAVRSSNTFFRLSAHDFIKMVTHSIDNDTTLNWFRFKYLKNLIIQTSTLYIGTNLELDEIYLDEDSPHSYMVLELNSQRFTPNVQEIVLNLDPVFPASFVRDFRQCNFQSVHSLVIDSLDSLLKCTDLSIMPALRYLQINNAVNEVMLLSQINAPNLHALYVNAVGASDNGFNVFYNDTVCNNLISLTTNNIDFNDKVLECSLVFSNCHFQNLIELCVAGLKFSDNHNIDINCLKSLRRIHLQSLNYKLDTCVKDFDRIFDLPLLEHVSTDVQINNNGISFFSNLQNSMASLQQMHQNIRKKCANKPFFKFSLYIGSTIPSCVYALVCDTLRALETLRAFEFECIFMHGKEQILAMLNAYEDKYNISLQKINQNYVARMVHNPNNYVIDEWLYDYKKYYYVETSCDASNIISAGQTYNCWPWLS